MADKKRNSLIKTIHTGRRYLQLDEETYRAFLDDVTRKSSCVLMSLEELEKVVGAMRNKGFTAQKQNFKNRQDKLLKNEQYCKCLVLWRELFEIGKVKNNHPMALNGYLKRICPAFKRGFTIEIAEFQKAIETLKQWRDRDPKQQAYELFNPDVNKKSYV